MANLDPLYIVGIELGEYFVDPRTALPLSGGTISFFKDLARVVPKPVYRLSGSPPNYEYLALPNSMELSDAGTIIDALGNEVSIYYFPWDADGNVERYYIVVKASDGETIKEFQAWPNNFEGGTTPTDASSSSENQVTNPQFGDVLFNPEHGITYQFTGAISAQEFEVAPGWNLRVSSSASGAIIVGRTSLEGSLNIPTNPPFILSIAPQGNSVSSLSLVQKLPNNPDIWANQYVAGSLTVTSLDGVNHAFEMLYAPSVSIEPTVILSGSSGESGYVTLSGTVLLPEGVNTQDGDIGYVDIEIVLPVSGNYAVTSVQAFGTDSAATLIPYQQETINRQKDHTFHYYNPLIQSIPAPSLSEGWDFKVNPAQFGNTQAVTTGASRYLWDQTIGWQSADNMMSAQRSAVGQLQITTADTCQIALVQYLSNEQMQTLLANGWSTVINAYTDIITGINGTVSFWYTTDATLPDITTGTNESLVSVLDANGKPTSFHGTWVELSNPHLNNAKFTIPYNSAQLPIASVMNGWAQPIYGVASTATYIAIVVGFAELEAGNIFFDSIAVTPGALAVPFAPIGAQATLEQMQKYYQSTYQPGQAPGTITVDNVFLSRSTGNQNIAGLGSIHSNFEDIIIILNTGVRSKSFIFTTYDRNNGTAGRFTVYLYHDYSLIQTSDYLFSDHFDLPSSAVLQTFKGISFLATDAAISTDTGIAALTIWSSYFACHYTIDARFGIVN